MKNVYKLILKAAAVDSNVLIYGEAGTGKESVARAIHNLSQRRHQKFIAVNCGAIPEDIIENELFAYKKDAFTGVDQDKIGFLDQLFDQGTLFLEDLEEMSPVLQVRVLQALDGHDFIPPGASHTRPSDIRVIAATNKSPRELIQNSRIREDFFYRISIIPILLPSLRERMAEVPIGRT